MAVGACDMATPGSCLIPSEPALPLYTVCLRRASQKAVKCSDAVMHMKMSGDYTRAVWRKCSHCQCNENGCVAGYCIALLYPGTLTFMGNFWFLWTDEPICGLAIGDGEDSWLKTLCYHVSAKLSIYPEVYLCLESHGDKWNLHCVYLQLGNILPLHHLDL